jgi:hypothetical protein
MDHNTFDCDVGSKELAKIGPHICSALLQYERKVDFQGRWNDKHFDNWNIGGEPLSRSVASQCIDHEFDHHRGFLGFGLPNVATPDNQNLLLCRQNCYCGIGSWESL